MTALLKTVADNPEIRPDLYHGIKVLHLHVGDPIPTPRAPERYAVRVSPDLARYLLTLNHPQNRNKKPTAIAKYARDMDQGYWPFTPESIVFSNRGVLEDGQNRLHAIELSGATVWMMFDFGWPEDLIQCINRASSRTNADALTVNGYPGASGTAGAMGIVEKYLATVGTPLRWSQRLLTSSESVERYTSDPEAWAAAGQWGMRIYNATQGLGPATWTAAYFVIAKARGPETAAPFFQAVIDETGDPGSASRKLKSHVLRRHLKDTASGDSREPMENIVRAFNAWSGGRSVGFVRTGGAFVLSAAAPDNAGRARPGMERARMIAGPRMVGPRKLHVLQGSPEWLAARREHITATDIAAIEGASPWKCEQDVADEKMTGNGAESTLVMRVGNALEDLIAAAYSEQTGRKVRRVRGLWESATIPWAAASPDATAAGRLVELKWTGSRSRFRDGLPEDVEIQARWQALVADVPEVDVAALTVGDDEVRIFTVGRDAGIESYLVGKAEDFRARLAAGGPFAQSTESLKRRHPADDGTELVADVEMADAVKALLDVRGRIGSLKGTEDALEVAIKTRMADAAALVGDGWRVTWKRTKDRTETDWKSLAAGLLHQMPETERSALVGLHSAVKEGFRPFRVTVGKGDTE